MMSKPKLKIILFYLISFMLVAMALTFSQYRARENDSRLYTKFVQQLTHDKPLKEIVALEWRDLSAYQDYSNPYVRDHLIGQFFIPVIAAKLGFPSKYSLYFFNTLYRLGFILLIFLIAAEFIGKNKAYILLWALQFNPVNLSYQLRANHEQFLLFCISLAIYGYVKLHQGISYKFLLTLGVIFAFLTKGVVSLLLGPVLLIVWFLLYKDNKHKLKSFFWMFIPYLFLCLTLVLYEIWFRAITGHPFMEAYFKIQIYGRSIKEQISHNPFIVQKLKNFYYYFSRSLVNSLPWALFLIITLIIKFIKTKTLKFNFNQPIKKLLILFSSFPIIYILFFSIPNRLAQRYIFPSYFFLTALILIVLIHESDWTQNVQDFLSKKIKGEYVIGLTWGLMTLIALIVYFLKGGNNHWL